MRSAQRSSSPLATFGSARISTAAVATAPALINDHTSDWARRAESTSWKFTGPTARERKFPCPAWIVFLPLSKAGVSRKSKARNYYIPRLPRQLFLPDAPAAPAMELGVGHVWARARS